MRRVRWDEQAVEEAIDAADFYEEGSAGGGKRFRAQLKTALAFLRSRPEAGSPVELPLRRVLLHGYPYSVLYIADSKEIFILGVMHEKREPGYWRERVGHYSPPTVDDR